MGNQFRYSARFKGDFPADNAIETIFSIGVQDFGQPFFDLLLK